MIDVYKKLFFLLSSREKRNAFLLFFITVIMGLLEVLGVASVMPFIAVVANPDIIHSNIYLKTVYAKLMFTNEQYFLYFLGILSFLIVVGSLTLKAITQWALARYTFMRNYTISYRLLKGYLSQPYTWFLNKHSSDLGKTILSEVGQVINGTLMPAMTFVANAIVTLFLVVLVIFVEPFVAISSLIILGGSYFIIYVSLRKYLSKIGQSRVNANRARFKMAQDALSGIKDIKVLGIEEGYLRGFSKPAALFAKMQASNQIVGTIPQFVLQGVAFGGMIAIIVFVLAVNNSKLDVVLPLIGLYAFAGMRMLPALQNVYTSLAKLRFGKPALDTLYKDMREISLEKNTSSRRHDSDNGTPIKLTDKFEIDNVSYCYPGAQKESLTDITLKIKAGSTVAFVGSTGAGKTTAVDLILGLLEPIKGELRVDGVKIEDYNIRNWQQSIGYVPQHIFLTDDSIAANIAFGLPHNKIDMRAVEKASRIANLHEFITKSLPNAYHSKIGERGVRLSGGQRQRIGIARALYHDPDVIILDEATSSLDNLTEKAVMNSVHGIGDLKTIIIVAHRLSTVENCDMLYFFENGKIISEGKYGDLLSNDYTFRKLANATSRP